MNHRSRLRDGAGVVAAQEWWGREDYQTPDAGDYDCDGRRDC